MLLMYPNAISRLLEDTMRSRKRREVIIMTRRALNKVFLFPILTQIGMCR